MGSDGVASLSNHEIVTIAVYLCGGRSGPVDLEDVAIKANALAPGRFTWRKYKDQISLEHVRVYLSDAKKEKNGCYLTGTGDAGWMLTEEGHNFARRAAKEIVGNEEQLARPRLSAAEKRWIARERSRLLESTIFGKAKAQGDASIALREAEQLFKLDDYVQGLARERKIDRYVALLGNDTDVGEVVRSLASRLRGEK